VAVELSDELALTRRVGRGHEWFRRDKFFEAGFNGGVKGFVHREPLTVEQHVYRSSVLDFQHEAFINLSLALPVAFAIGNDAHLVTRPQRRHVGNLAEVARLQLSNIVLDGKLRVSGLRARSNIGKSLMLLHCRKPRARS
jgi:hypothetical protein